MLHYRARFGVGSALLAMAVVPGCHEAPKTPAMVFALGSLGDQAAVSEVMPRGSGQLVVQLSGVVASLSRKRVLATTSDVDHIEVTLSADGQTDRTHSLDKAALALGQSTVTFGALLPGNYRIVVKVYDASGAVIGESVDTATVVAGTVTQAPVGVVLAPTYVQPSTISGPGGSGAGGLSTAITIVNGPTLESPAPLPSSLIPDGLYSFAGVPTVSRANNGGYMWVGDGRDVWSASMPDAALVKYAADGQELLRTHFWQTLPAGTKFGESVVPDGTRFGGVAPLLVDVEDQVWAGLVQNSSAVLHPTTPLDAGLMRLAPDGTKRGHYIKDRYIFDLAEGPDGDVWVAAQQFSNSGERKPLELFRFDGDGTQKLARAVPEPSGDEYVLDCDPFGNVWTICSNDAAWNETPLPGLLRKYMPGGDTFKLYDTGETLRCMFVDRFGQVWVGAEAPNNTLKLLVYSNSGIKLAEKAWLNDAVSYFYFNADRSGRVWVGDDYGAMKVYDPTTLAELAAYPNLSYDRVGAPFSFDHSGHLWQQNAGTGKVARIPIR